MIPYGVPFVPKLGLFNKYLWFIIWYTDLPNRHNNLLNSGLWFTKPRITINQVLQFTKLRIIIYKVKDHDLPNCKSRICKWITNNTVQGSIWINDRINKLWYELYMSQEIYKKPLMDLRPEHGYCCRSSGAINTAAIILVYNLLSS